jgi:hypothetical protein
VQRQRDVSLLVEGGSNVDFGRGGEQTVRGQLRYVPLALMNMLFRPSLVDVRNGAMLLAAVELTFIFALFVRIALAPRRKTVLAIIRRTPLLLASLTFVLIFSVGVGLATTNLGTLSRYRTPMMPFYVAFAVLLHRRLVAAPAAAAKAAAKADELSRRLAAHRRRTSRATAAPSAD